MIGKRTRNLVALLASGGAVMIAASPALTQNSPPPPVRYTIDAGTMSGMAAMGAGAANGGSGGGLGAAMAMMGGGGNQPAHELTLRIGSPRQADGPPKADHFMPQGAGLGASVPLNTPGPVGREEPAERLPNDMQTPSGRLLLYWGCGETAGPGQPVVIDFSKLARGQIPQGLMAPALNLPEEWSIRQGNSTTYGWWANGHDGKSLPANASLLGQHRIAGNYSPEINFNLAQDFMPALRTTTRDLPGGAVALSWAALNEATGYYAWVMAMSDSGGGQPRDIVWWSSSATQQFGGPMAEWIAPAGVRRLIDARTVMAPTQTECTIPAEVKRGGEMMIANLYAYGPEVNFAYPPRPENPRTAWRPEWTARVRYRSHTMFMPGMEGMMGGFGGGQQAETGQAAQPEQPRKPRCRGLGGIAARAAGLCE